MKRDTAHLIQTLNVPLVIFFVPPQARRLKCVAEKTFLQNEIHIYNKRIFLANKAYRIPSGHKYVLFSTQVNFFSLDVVDEGLDIPSDYINPIKTVVTKLLYTIERPDTRIHHSYSKSGRCTMMIDCCGGACRRSYLRSK